MKRLLVYGLILVFCCGVSSYATSYFAPQWSEFCPVQYQNLSPEKSYILQDKKYWQQRKKEFDSKVNQCSALSGAQKDDCYNQIRVIELNATETFLREKEISAIRQNYNNCNCHH